MKIFDMCVGVCAAKGDRVLWTAEDEKQGAAPRVLVKNLSARVSAGVVGPLYGLVMLRAANSGVFPSGLIALTHLMLPEGNYAARLPYVQKLMLTCLPSACNVQQEMSIGANYCREVIFHAPCYNCLFALVVDACI